MGYCIWVADDPELAELEASDDDDPQTKDSGYPYFSTSNRAMAALGEEMQAQGMFEFMPFEFGERTLESQVERALAVAKDEPITASDPEMRELWTKWIEFLRESMDHGGFVPY
jgi:hypothetical protein